MHTVEKALWYIERHSLANPSLKEVADAVGVSPFHLTRVFAAATGLSVMRYARARRLSGAARTLATGKGAPGILEVALDAGYESHGAFSRAFRDLFGVTPETVRERRSLESLELVEALRMNQPTNNQDTAATSPVRFENDGERILAGIIEHYSCDNNADIAGQWQRFLKVQGKVPGRIGTAAYGVCCNFDDNGNYDYLCGVEVRDTSDLVSTWTRLRLKAQRYAVFVHRGHVASIMNTWNGIWNWMPESGHEAVEAPQFEKYGEDFNPATGEGGFEIWIPVENKKIN